MKMHFLTTPSPKLHLSLRSKIYGFLAILLGLFIALITLFFMQIEQIFDEQCNGYQAQQQIQQAVNLSGTIEKLQRHVQNYTLTGQLDSAEQARKLYQQIFSGLSTTPKNALKPINQEPIRAHLERYYTSFNKLIIQRSTHNQLREKLRTIGSSIEQRLKTYYRLSIMPLSQDMSQKLLLQAYKAEKFAFKYFESLDAQNAQAALDLFEEMAIEHEILSASPQGTEQQALLALLLNDFDNMQKTFIRSIQHTRGYLSLVNVVMAADAYEVLYYAKQMNTQAQAENATIQKKLDAQYHQVIGTSIAGAISLIVISLILVLMNVRSIVRPIEKLSQAFQKISQGDTDISLPVFDTEDEIGTLARFAHRYQQKNLETHQLLEQSETLSKELLTFKERLKIATESAQIGIWDLNLQTKQLIWDEMMFKIYHADPKEFDSNHDLWNTFIHHEDKQRAQAELELAIRHRSNLDSVYRILWPNGQIRYIKTFAVIVENAQGKPARAVGVNYDITEFEALKNHLEQRVVEEVAKQQEQEQILIQQSKMAAMGEMLSAISHQWRQPLNVISLYLQDLLSAHKHHQLDATLLQDNISKSRQQIDFMAKTIDDFRNFFTPNSEEMEINLKEMIEKTLKMFEAQLKNNDIRYELVAEEADYRLRGNAIHLQQSLTNLLSNAIDAIKQRRHKNPETFEATLQIFLKRHREDYSIDVIDNGIGLGSEPPQRAFEPYFTTKPQGTGIGLYITRTILTKYFNGRIDLYPQEQGTRATIRIPITAKRSLT